jgi:hypothetical protein
VAVVPRILESLRIGKAWATNEENRDLQQSRKKTLTTWPITRRGSRLKVSENVRLYM